MLRLPLFSLLSSNSSRSDTVTIFCSCVVWERSASREEIWRLRLCMICGRSHCLSDCSSQVWPWRALPLYRAKEPRSIGPLLCYSSRSRVLHPHYGHAMSAQRLLLQSWPSGKPNPQQESCNRVPRQSS
ncbi:hypothetical protein BV20DRAFT_458915 [Pilatotrama ljubarskyi]|nr:hypothetical protein BV20DRAFT_458915 [Pilatotrama ljubarskyi]